MSKSRIENLGLYGKATTVGKKSGGMGKFLNNVHNQGFKQGVTATGAFLLGAYSIGKAVSSVRDIKRQDKMYYEERIRAKRKAFLDNQQAHIEQMALELKQAKEKLNTIKNEISEEEMNK